MATPEALFNKLAQPDEHARFEAAQSIARLFGGPQGRAHFLDPALIPYLRVGLTYDSTYVRSFTISQLAVGCRDPAVAQHLGSSGILIDALRYLPDANLEIVKNVVELIKALSSSPDGVAFLFSQPVLELLRQHSQHKNEAIRFRALEAVVEIAHASPEAYEKMNATHLLTPLHEGLAARNMLERLSCLPLVEKLCQTAWGFDGLQKEGVFQHLIKEAEKAREHEAMVTNNILYLLGRLMRQSPNKELLPLESLFPLLRAVLDDNDVSLNEAGITLVGDILSTKPGAEALVAPAQKSLVLHYLEYLSSGNQVLRICAYHSLTVGLSNTQNSAILEQIVNVIPLPGASQVNFTYLMMNYMKQPFQDIRSAVLAAMKALAAFDWGVKLLFSFPGFPEWLVDRRTELAKEGKIEKYEVVKAIADNAYAKANLVDAEYRKLERFVSEGPFYVRAEASVDIADKSA